MSTGECCECGAQQKIACQHCDAKEAWISVEDCLPMTVDRMDTNYSRIEVIVCSEDGLIFPAEYVCGNTIEFWGQFESYFGYAKGITHWQPYPSPPEVMKDKA